MGVTIDKLSTCTANESWEREFVSKQDICRKLLTLENLSVFLNFTDDLFYDHLTYDFDEEFLDENQRKSLLNKTEKEKEKLLQVFKYKYFISQGSQIDQHNSYLIHNFCVESRLVLNKTPETNQLPQVDLNLMLGGKSLLGIIYNTATPSLATSVEQLIDVRLQQQQLIAILKFLEYSGYYTKFRAEVLKEFEVQEFTVGESEVYIDTYIKYRHHLNDLGSK